jgi:hypothetical protein
VNDALTLTDSPGLTVPGVAIPAVVKLGGAVGAGVFSFPFPLPFGFTFGAGPWSPPVVPATTAAEVAAGCAVPVCALAIGADTANVATSCELSCLVHPGVKARTVTV